MKKLMKRNLWWIISIIHLIVFIVSLSGCRLRLIPPRVEVGTSKADVIDQLGDPEETRTIYKQTEYIWGPEEAWWDTLEMGDSIEIWVYQYPKGTYQLYFLNDSENVDFEAFIDKDIVY